MRTPRLALRNFNIEGLFKSDDRPEFPKDRGCKQTNVARGIALALLVLGGGLAGCADMGDNVTLAFADPAKYDLYSCKQLEPERKALTAAPPNCRD